MTGGTEENPDYQIGSPIFDEVKIQLQNGQTFTIQTAKNSPDNVLVEKAFYNNKQLNAFKITQEDLEKGGTLKLEMYKD